MEVDLQAGKTVTIKITRDRREVKLKECLFIIMRVFAVILFACMILILCEFGSIKLMQLTDDTKLKNLYT